MPWALVCDNAGMVWTLLLVGHLVGLVGYTLLLRKSALGSLNKLVLAALMQTGIFIPSLLFLAFGYVSFVCSPLEWGLILLAAAMITGLHIVNVWALSRLDASLFTILYNLRLLAITILGFLFLGELPTVLQMVGGLIILVSIALLNLHRDSRWRSVPILIGLGAMLWFSLHAVLEKYNLGLFDIEGYIFLVSFAATVMLWGLVFLMRIDVRSQVMHIHDRKIYALLAARVLSAYAYMYALLYGSLAVTNYVSGMGVALVVLFGVFLLGEKDEMWQKLAAVAVACVGLTCILVGRLAT